MKVAQKIIEIELANDEIEPGLSIEQRLDIVCADLNELDDVDQYIVGQGDDGIACVILANVVFADDGNCEVRYDMCTAEEAAEKYVSTGSWGDIESTIWVSVHTHKKGWDLAGDEIRFDSGRFTIQLDPHEPSCVDGETHDWHSPLALLGGLKENPGVYGHGGGVICTQVCAHCGTYVTSDSWAQNPETGEQGLHSVSYRNVDKDSREWVEKRLLDEIVEPVLDDCNAVIKYKNNGTEIVATLCDDMEFDAAVESVRKAINNERIDASMRTDMEEDRTLSITVETW